MAANSSRSATDTAWSPKRSKKRAINARPAAAAGPCPQADAATLLGAFPERDVAAGSPVDVLGRLAARLVPGRPLLPQTEAAVVGYREGRFAPVAGLVSSVPDESPKRLRALFYGMSGLANPSRNRCRTPFPSRGFRSQPFRAMTGDRGCRRITPVPRWRR